MREEYNSDPFRYYTSLWFRIPIKPKYQPFVFSFLGRLVVSLSPFIRNNILSH